MYIRLEEFLQSLFQQQTIFGESHPLLLQFVRHRFCNQQHRRAFKVIESAQTWPYKLRKLLALGISG